MIQKLKKTVVVAVIALLVPASATFALQESSQDVRESASFGGVWAEAQLLIQRTAEILADIFVGGDTDPAVGSETDFDYPVEKTTTVPDPNG